jgi:glycosyltransferase involved in cell wall biosynthesis
MKVLHVVEPFSSGIITFIIHLTREIDQYEHIVFHGQRTTEDEEHKVKERFPPDVKFIKWISVRRNISFWYDVKALVQLMREVKKSEYDVIHLHSAKAGFLGRIATKIVKRKQVIYTPNGAPFLRQDVAKWKQAFFLFLEKFANKLNGIVICCSKSESEEYIKRNVNCSYINNGTEICPTERIVHDDIIIGSMGIATYQKNPKQFNEIAEEFVDKKNVKFIWVGGGELLSVLTSPNITVTGWLNKEETNGWLRKIDIFLSCALWEGLPFAVLEAMNAKCSLLLSDCVGNSDLVIPSENGYLFKNTNQAIKKLELMIKEPQLLQNFGHKSFQYCAQNFDIKSTGKQYESLYKNIAQTS